MRMRPQVALHFFVAPAVFCRRFFCLYSSTPPPRALPQVTGGETAGATPHRIHGRSRMVRTRSAATSARTVFWPDGQRTVMESARSALPSPKCNRRSLCER